MEQILGRIEKDGKPVLNRVIVTIESILDERSGLDSWHGYFECDVKDDLELDEYQLFLEDGRRGEIIIDNMNVIGGSESVPVTFRGSGALK